MADERNAGSDRTPTPDELSLNRAPKGFSKATLAVIAVALVFLIIASFLFSSFFNSSTGIPGGAATNANLGAGR